MPDAPVVPSTAVSTPKVAAPAVPGGSVVLPGKAAGLTPSSRIKGIVAETLKSKGKVNTYLPGTEDPPKAPEAPVKPDPTKPTEGEVKPGEGEAKPGEVDPKLEKSGEKPGEQKPGEKKGDKAPGPWQLKEKYEKLAKTYEKENTELKQKLAEMGDREELLKRNKELEERFKSADEELRYVNYSKSEEFKEKYEKPYVEAWQTAVAELSQVDLTMKDGTTRKMTNNDLVHLANMDPGTLTTTLKEMSPDFADDIKAHIREIRKLSAAQTKALEDAKKKGTEYFDKQSTSIKEAQAQANKIWNEQQATIQNRELLKEKEGDDEWNAAVKKSTEFVDSAFKGNIFDPKLTPEQRDKLVKDKVKMRIRALEAPVLKLENTRLKAQLEAVQKELNEIKSSGPGSAAGGKRDNGEVAAGSSPMERAKAGIRQRARPGA